MSVAQDLLRHVIGMGHFVVKVYVEDLSDSELLVRSTPGANHIAWQLGHLIASTQGMLQTLGREAPALPDGFAAAYTSQTAASDAPADFATKAQYLAWMEQIRVASLAAVDLVKDADLEKPGPEKMREYAPTIGAIYQLLGSHWLLHAGQFVPIRRKLGKKPMF